VDLPDAENRMKILRIILNRENLEADFQFDKLANATEGYSGSDLKVMLYWLLLISNLRFLEENIWP
jgi:ATP-dependent 26S proteasome regulatory subunit